MGLLAFPGSLIAPLCLSSPVLPRVDSIMLVEEGFSVTSVDASDKMLKYALKERWNRRHEPAFDKWGTRVQPGRPSQPSHQGHGSLCLGLLGGVFCFPQGHSKITVISLKREA